jgi:hypothetical protein
MMLWIVERASPMRRPGEHLLGMLARAKMMPGFPKGYKAIDMIEI